MTCSVIKMHVIQCYFFVIVSKHFKASLLFQILGVPAFIVILTLGINKTENYGHINSGM